MQPQDLFHEDSAASTADLEVHVPRQAELDVEMTIAPGDIFFTREDATAFMRIGTAGGFLGHVLQIIGKPRCLLQGQAEVHVQSVWPAGVEKMWFVKTLESTRDAEGLYEADSLFYVDSATERMILLGREDETGTLKVTTGEEVEVWHAPDCLRSNFRISLMKEVLTEMKACNSSWSLTTAVRAVFFSGMMGHLSEKGQLLSDISSSWTVEPICTSIAIIFWQRYLSKLAEDPFFDCRLPTGASVNAKAVNLIQLFMPLRADRVLPGKLQTTLTQCGWCCQKRVMSKDALREVPKPRQRRERRGMCGVCI